MVNNNSNEMFDEDKLCDLCSDPLGFDDIMDGEIECKACREALAGVEEPYGLDIEFIPDEDL